MSAFSFRIPVGTSDLFNELPKSAKHFLKDGLKVVARVHQQHGPLLANMIMESAATGTDPKASDLAASFRLSEDESQTLIGAISFIKLIFSKPGEPEPVASVVNSLISSEILDASAQAEITSVLNEIDQNRSTVAQGLRRSHLAARLLASFIDLNTVVDIRLDFDKDQIAVAVPVVLVHIDTDVNEQEIRFQLTRKQLEGVIEDLKQTLIRVEAAEKWIRGR